MRKGLYEFGIGNAEGGIKGAFQLPSLPASCLPAYFLLIPHDLDPGSLAAVFAAAAFLAASSFGDVQRVGIVATIAAGAPAAIVRRNRLFEGINHKSQRNIHKERPSPIPDPFIRLNHSLTTLKN